MAEEDVAGGKNVADYSTFEEFLSSQVTQLDLIYLEDINVARKLVELGYRGTKEGYSEEQFWAKKAAIEARKQIHCVKTIVSAGKTYEDAMLRALQQREEGNRTGKNASIIFVRDKNEYGQEISGYIDYAHRLATEDITPVFEGKKRFLPRPTDLSFLNWETMNVSGKESPHYKVIAKCMSGMVFRNKKDGKILNPDPFVGGHGDNSSRTVVPTTKYTSVIVFDHYNRRKT
ncbi:hypothetical protein RRG08_047252 [Elysia crispata]|uniref:Cilia- and flagella-associated protein 299 n=1 Tax=Elysia crispata TaxID=231223 RepID=A0AAE1A2S2_9GAST|nr:hypothetical protein RRG08_047252 [Elysia crispata]